MTGDGLVDMVESVGGTWRVRRNQGSPVFDFGPPENTGIPDSSATCKKPIRALDRDANGRGDILLSNASCSSVLLGMDDGGLLTAAPSDIVNPAGALAFDLVDLNGDGLSDLFRTPLDVATGQPGSPLLRWNTGAGYLPPVDFSLGPASKDVLPIDANGDGREDLLAVEPIAGGTTHDLRLYLSMANDVVGPELFTYVLNTSPIPHQLGGTGITSGDFDGDGDADLLEWVSAPGSGALMFAQDLVLRRIELPSDPDKLVEVWDEGADHPRERFVYSRVWNDAPSPDSCAYPTHCMSGASSASSLSNSDVLSAATTAGGF